MVSRVSVKEVRKLLTHNPDMKPSQRAEILKDVMKNTKLVFSRRAKRMMMQEIKRLEEAARWENFPYSNI